MNPFAKHPRALPRIALPPRLPRPMPPWLVRHLQEKEHRRMVAIASLWTRDVSPPPRYAPTDLLATVLYWALCVALALILCFALT